MFKVGDLVECIESCMCGSCEAIKGAKLKIIKIDSTGMILFKIHGYMHNPNKFIYISHTKVVGRVHGDIY